MKSQQQIPHWYDVYPQGTKEGDEEIKFFKELARNPQFKWRSTSAIAKSAGLSKERCEEIIQKYAPLGVVLHSKKNENNWAYWERVPKSVASMLDKRSIGQKNKDQRVKGFSNSDADDAIAEDDDDD